MAGTRGLVVSTFYLGSLVCYVMQEDLPPIEAVELLSMIISRSTYHVSSSSSLFSFTHAIKEQRRTLKCGILF